MLYLVVLSASVGALYGGALGGLIGLAVAISARGKGVGSLIEGRIGFFKLQATPYIYPTEEQLTLWIEASTAYYENVDWALDISQAEFTFAPDLHFMPGSLIRIDPTTQALVTRKKAMSLNANSLPWKDTAFDIGLKCFIRNSPYDDVVLVAAKKGKGFAADVKVLELLRQRGIAEPS